MERRPFGKTGMQTSVLGFGGSEIGFEQASQETVDRLLGNALDAGMNVIDTAECYRNSEELIGRSVAHRRSDYYLFTKCGHASGLEGLDWDPAMLRRQIDRSLERLKTDHVDLLQLHTCSKEELEKGDVVAVLQEAKAAGKTRFIGYSGDRDAALHVAMSGAFDSLQTSINIADQSVLDQIVPLAYEHGMGVIAKRPIANVAWASGDELPEAEYPRTYWKRLQELKYEYLKNVADPAERVGIALRFTLSQPGVCTAIVGTKNPDRWASNAAMADQGPLPADLLAVIRNRWQAAFEPDWLGMT